MKSKKSANTFIPLTPREQLSLKMLAFRAGASYEETIHAILQNAAGMSYGPGSVNFKVTEAEQGMPTFRRGAAMRRRAA